ncbi:caskin-2-like isoform X2 [Panonychus citri]|nr:caskin-2-like isoform X2 [Panonychus citri]XP_053204965.1 caskin-2-like isoform X2 [Panonychus citri]
MGNAQGTRRTGPGPTFDYVFGPDSGPCPFKVPKLHRLVRQSDHGKLAKLIAAGDNVDSQDQDGMTPLHYAAAQGDLISVQLLTEAGCSQIPCKLNIYPIHLAVQNGNQQVIQQILDYGGNVDSYDSMGTTPLGLAIEFDSPSVVSLLLQRKAFLDSNYLLESIRQGLLEITRILINFNPSLINNLKLDRFRFNSKSTDCLKLLYLVGYKFDNNFSILNQSELRFTSCHIEYIDRQYKHEMTAFHEFLEWMKNQQKPMKLKFLARIVLLKACGSQSIDNFLDGYPPIPPTIRDFVSLRWLL